MLGIFNCGGGGEEAWYDEDYDDSLYGDGMTLRSYRGRAERPAFDDDKSATERERRQPPPELGTNLHALAMRRMSSHRVTVAVEADGGRLSHRKRAVTKHKQQQRRGRYYNNNKDQDDEEQVVTQLHTVRRPQSFIAQKQNEMGKREQSALSAARPPSQLGVPKEICIEIEPGERRESPNQAESEDREPASSREDVSRDDANEIASPREDSRGSGADSRSFNNARDTRPPRPYVTTRKHIRIRIRKPLGIVFESLTGGGVRISELPVEGNAARYGRLEIWDELISINGRSTRHKTFDEVMDLFASTDPREKLDLVFRRKVSS
mmetsp:Transcript_33791/g.74393  ORF Transcript_33791/g.74393 Transcript_33791/m.74393 type:complete len:322 (-) Transcript_33791:137-1102(-)